MKDHKECSQAHDVMKGDLAYPLKPACPGTPALQLAMEAQERQRCREEWRRKHPGEWDMPNDVDWHERQQEYDRIEQGKRLFGGGHEWPRTFEPGDAFVPHGEESD